MSKIIEIFFTRSFFENTKIVAKQSNFYTGFIRLWWGIQLCTLVKKCIYYIIYIQIYAINM